MKPSGFILAAFLIIAILCCLMADISWQYARIRIVDTRVISCPAPPTVPIHTFTGIFSNPNFQVVLLALEKRNGDKKLPEPEFVTRQYSAINRSYYNQTFMLPITNK
jgi:hypothetical protein